MAPVDWSWGEAYGSPVLMSLPQPVPSFNPHAGMSGTSLLHQATYHNALTNSHISDQWTQPNQFQNLTNGKSGRKRSREEMTEGYEEEDSSRSVTASSSASRITPSPPKGEPMMGPGMTLIYPDSSISTNFVDAASQTGTWAEELSERLRSSSVRERALERRESECRKSVRLDKEATKVDDIQAAVTPMGLRTFTEEGPTIDEATITLGIGWTTLPSNSTMDSASRGWARYIETHFPLQSVKIVWQNTSFPAYLISAITCDGRARTGSPAPISRPTSPWASNRVGSPGYYLFDEQLMQGRLVAKSWDRTLSNLRESPIVFDGEDVMESSTISNAPTGTHTLYWAGWNPNPERSNVVNKPIASIEENCATSDGMDIDM